MNCTFVNTTCTLIDLHILSVCREFLPCASTVFVSVKCVINRLCIYFVSFETMGNNKMIM